MIFPFQLTIFLNKLRHQKHVHCLGYHKYMVVQAGHLLAIGSTLAVNIKVRYSHNTQKQKLYYNQTKKKNFR